MDDCTAEWRFQSISLPSSLYWRGGARVGLEEFYIQYICVKKFALVLWCYITYIVSALCTRQNRGKILCICVGLCVYDAHIDGHRIRIPG